jgi:hypothetical protein
MPIAIGIIRLEFRDRFIANLIESLLASGLVRNQNRFTNRLSDEMANLVRQRRIDILSLDLALGIASIITASGCS